LAAQLNSPDIIKYFGGNNVVVEEIVDSTSTVPAATGKKISS
jgi:hypothetical protein